MMEVVPVLEGFKQDVTELLDEFRKECEVDSISHLNDQSIYSAGNFIHFRNAWIRVKFPLVFHGFVHENRAKEFMDEAFALILSWIDPDDKLLTDQCAFIYLLYSMYHRQKVSPRLRIRLQATQLPSIRALMSRFLEQKMLDPIYCWHRLLAQNGIFIVAEQNWFGPSIARVKASTTHEFEDRSSLSDQFKAQLNEVKAFHRDYVKMKELIQGDGEEEIRTMDMLNEVNPFEECMQKFQKLIKQSTRESESNASSDTDDQ